MIIKFKNFSSFIIHFFENLYNNIYNFFFITNFINT